MPIKVKRLDLSLLLLKSAFIFRKIIKKQIFKMTKRTPRGGQDSRKKSLQKNSLTTGSQASTEGIFGQPRKLESSFPKRLN